MSLTEELLPDAWDSDPQDRNPYVFIGIDPGMDGAIAILGPGVARVYDTPVQEAKTKGREYVPAAIRDLLEPYVGARAVLEYASTPRLNPGDMGYAVEGGKTKQSGNVTSALKIGFGSGLWEGILTAYHITFERPVPRKWRKAVGLATGEDKRASLELARSLFPELLAELRLQKNHGRAEALLMAHYCRERWTAPAPPARRRGKVEVR